nr:MAG TPA: harmonin [Caudoviricetes sp.]
MRWDCLIMALRVILTTPSYRPAWRRLLCLIPI